VQQDLIDFRWETLCGLPFCIQARLGVLGRDLLPTNYATP